MALSLFWNSVFSVLSMPSCSWILPFSPFWWLRCLFLYVTSNYNYSAILSISLVTVFFVSLFFASNTPSNESFAAFSVEIYFL